MCGIIGYTGKQAAVEILVEGLKRLEYRGYDSAGVAIVDPRVGLQVHRVSGKVSRLEEVLRGQEVKGRCGVGHTRWATHGQPSEANAHPHRDCRGRLALVHNGIIENYLPLRRELEERGHRFASETDTEALVRLGGEAWGGGGSGGAVRRGGMALWTWCAGDEGARGGVGGGRRTAR